MVRKVGERVKEGPQPASGAGLAADEFDRFRAALEDRGLVLWEGDDVSDRDGHMSYWPERGPLAAGDPVEKWDVINLVGRVGDRSRPDGEGDDKRSLDGGTRGLIVPAGWERRAARQCRLCVGEGG